MVGIDIIDIERVDGSDEFLNKIANEKEIEYVKKSFCDSLRLQRAGACSGHRYRGGCARARGCGASRVHRAVRRLGQTVSDFAWQGP